MIYKARLVPPSLSTATSLRSTTLVHRLPTSTHDPMVSSIDISLTSLYPVQNTSGNWGIDIHSPTFITNISKLMKVTLDARHRGDEELLARVQSEVDAGGDAMRLSLLQDELRYRRDEECTVVGTIGRLLMRLRASEAVDMERIDSEAALKRTSEQDELDRLRRERGIIEDMQRRAEASYDSRRDERLQELHRRYPGTPEARRLPSRLDRDFPRRRAASIANFEKAKEVFDQCDRVSKERQRRREEEEQDLSHITAFSADDSIMEEDEDDSDDSDDEGNELTIHGNFQQTVRAVQLAAPPQRHVLLADLKSQWEKVRTEVDQACREWEQSKINIASSSTARARRAYYTAIWAQLKAYHSALAKPLTFSTFPWPLLATPTSVNSISVAQVAEFFDEGPTSPTEKKKILQDAMKQWHSESFKASRVLQQVHSQDVETIKLGRMVVHGHLAQLLQDYA